MRTETKRVLLISNQTLCCSGCLDHAQAEKWLMAPGSVIFFQPLDRK